MRTLPAPRRATPKYLAVSLASRRTLQIRRVGQTTRLAVRSIFLHPPDIRGPGNLFPNPALPGTATQINNYLGAVNGQANPNALYLISSGINSVTAAFLIFGTNSTLANTYLFGEAQALANSIAQLQAAGARYIIVTDGYAPPVVAPIGLTYGTTLLPQRGPISQLQALGSFLLIPSRSWPRWSETLSHLGSARLSRPMLASLLRRLRVLLATGKPAHRPRRQIRTTGTSYLRMRCRPTCSWMAPISRSRAR